jgi:hypothetical protein
VNNNILWKCIQVENFTYPPQDLNLFFCFTMNSAWSSKKAKSPPLSLCELPWRFRRPYKSSCDLLPLTADPTACSSGRDKSCCSSCNKLNPFSLRSVWRLTSARNSCKSVTTFGISCLSEHSPGVFFGMASRSSGYRASRVVGFVGYALSSSLRESGRRSRSYKADLDKLCERRIWDLLFSNSYMPYSR